MLRITELQPEPGYRLRLSYSDGAQGTVDLSEFAGRGVFAAWEEPVVFERAEIGEDGAVRWGDQMELCPNALYLRMTGKPPEEVFAGLRPLSVCVAFLLLMLCVMNRAGAQPANMAKLQPPPDIVGPRPPLRSWPHTDGSTSTQPLDTFIACTLGGWGLKPYAPRLTMLLFPAGQRFAQPAVEFEQVGPPGPPPPLRAGMPTRPADPRWLHAGTHGSYVKLIHDEADLIYVARQPSELERRVARAHHFELDVRPIAKDAFVFLVHEDNPVSRLTLEQVRGIYTGEITNWQEVGGSDHAIAAYQRDPQSGSQQLMLDRVMGGRSMVEVKWQQQHLIRNTMSGAINAIDEHASGIGYSVFYYHNYMQPGKHTKLLAINGVTPTRKTIAAERYPLTTKVYVATRHMDDQDSPLARLRDWLLDKEGQRVVAASGYVPIGSADAAQAVPAKAK